MVMMPDDIFDVDAEGNLISRREGSKDERAAAKAAIGWTPERGVEAGQTFVPNVRRWISGQGWVEPISTEENPELGAGYWRTDVPGGAPGGIPHSYISGEPILPIDKLPGDDESPYDKWERWKRDENIRGAKAIIEGFLKKFGLGELTSIAMGWAESGMSSDAMLVELRYGADPTVRKVYDGRFPAMQARRNAGFREISEGEYLDFERGILQIASRAGIEADFLAGDARTMAEDGVTALIGGDVSLAEWRDRVGIAEEAANSANDETIALLRSRYGFGQGDIVSSFLNPELTKNIVDARREFGAAGLAAQSQITLGPTQTFSQELSEDLQRMNVQQREVAARLSPLQGLTTSLLYSGGLSGDVLGGAAFGTTAADSSRVRRTQQGRAAQFSGDSGLLATREGLTGFGRAT